MYEYQRTNRYFAQIAGGMEDLGVEELSGLGAAEISPAYRGIYFNAGREELYRINYETRLISRVLAPLETFRCHNTDYLYRKARAVKWDHFLSPQQTFAIFANVSHSKIRHSKFAALRLKDAVADYFRETRQKRPSVKTIDPDLWFNLYIENDWATISLDVSGGSLHRRGYRQAQVKAPMQETLAAAIIRLSEWEGEKPLYDPMCGSGTLLSEALMTCCRIPPGFLRSDFGFMHLPDFDAGLWQRVRTGADSRQKPLPPDLIAGSDISQNAVTAARKNLRMLPEGSKIRLQKMDFRKIPGLQNSVIVCNPPYGIRQGEKDKLGALYKSLGDFLKQRCQGSTAYIYCGERELISSIGLKPAWKKPLVNGALDGRLLKIEIY